jgi:hypothetical protein
MKKDIHVIASDDDCSVHYVGRFDRLKNLMAVIKNRMGFNKKIDDDTYNFTWEQEKEEHQTIEEAINAVCAESWVYALFKDGHAEVEVPRGAKITNACYGCHVFPSGKIQGEYLEVRYKE